MRYLSVFSGIEAATVAWQDLGWELAGVCEIEPFPCSALAHHYPNVKNYGDITKYKEWDIERGSIDLIVGGSPCQAFSTAGLRKGLEDPRGNLALTYLGLIDHLRPEWIVWENVPGVLSSNGGRDFGTFLGALAELNYGWASRCLNAEYYGTPQRRRRVYLVGHSSGDWRRGTEVLFESTCLQGNPKKGRTKRKNPPTTTQRGVAISDSQGRAGNQSLTDSHQVDATNQSFVVGEKGVPYRKSARAQSADGYETWVEGDVSNTINCYDVGDIRSTNISVHVYENHPNDSRVKDMGDVCSTVTSRWGTGGGNVPIVNHATMYTRADDTKISTSKNFIVHRPSDNIANTINTGNHMTPEDVLCIEPIDKVYAFEPGSIARNAGPAGLSEQCPTLRASMGDNQPAVLYTDAIPIQDVREVQKSQNGLGVGDVDSPAYTIDTRATQGVAQAQCFLHQTAGDMRGLDLRDKAILMSHQQTSVMYNMIVRRLTPVESLRLQGFPDDYLDVLHNGRKPGDNAVFKAIGNSMATPVMKYIGQRIQMSIDKHST